MKRSRQEIEIEIDSMWAQASSMIANGRACKARLRDAYTAWEHGNLEVADKLMDEALEFLS